MVRIFVIGAAVVLSLVWVMGASAEMKEGLWEITTKVEMKGMPAGMPPTTMQQCITKKDLAPQPPSKGEGTECTRKEQKITGDTVTYVMECKSKEGTVIEISGKMVYKGNTFDGASATTINRKGQPPMQMSGKMSGKYLGPCK
jgi:hypothetical protein